MYIEAYDGVGGAPLRAPVTQIVVFSDAGTPLLVAGEYGTERSQAIARVGDEDFERLLQALGFGRHRIQFDELHLPRPAGQRLYLGES